MRSYMNSVEELVPGNFLFEFSVEDPALKACLPGQFVQLWLPGVGECAISVCSGNVDKTLELMIRRVGRVTSSFAKMQKGQLVGIRGPFGRGFPVDLYKGKDICIVAGGCGVAPVRGLWQYILDRRQDYGRLLLVYGMRNPGDMLFVKDFKKLAKRKDVELYLASEEFPTKEEPVIKMLKGLVTVPLSAAPITPQYHIAVCGPPIMYKFVVKDLKERGVPDSNIWLSLERHMKCGVGKCGHCFIDGRFTCKDGPVYSLEELRFFSEVVECG
jgi:sulfhydrogenase subunit gamma (sulfur reductase)